MRVVAESLNQSLFSRNQRGSSRGMRSLGIFSLAVFRGQYLFLAQCGAAHAILIQASGFQHFHDPSAVGRGLGMGRATPIQYHQAAVAPGNLFVISHTLPQAWNQALLRSLYGKPLEEIRSQLLEQTDADLEAVFIQIAAGSGEMRTLRSDPAKAERVELPPPPNDALPRKDISPPAPAVELVILTCPLPRMMCLPHR